MLARAGSNSLSLSFGFREASVPPVFQVVYKISERQKVGGPRSQAEVSLRPNPSNDRPRELFHAAYARWSPIPDPRLFGALPNIAAALAVVPQANRIHVRQIQWVQTASSGADPGDQSDQNARVSGPLGVGFHRGAVDEALLKIIQTPLENITQLRLMNQTTGLIAHRVEVVAQGAGRWQFQSQMLEPEFERNGLLQQQAGVLVFAAAVQTAQHQEKVDDICFGAGPAYLQFDVIDFELAQLKLQFGQIRSLARQELCVG